MRILSLVALELAGERKRHFHEPQYTTDRSSLNQNSHQEGNYNSPKLCHQKTTEKKKIIIIIILCHLKRDRTSCYKVIQYLEISQKDKN